MKADYDYVQIISLNITDLVLKLRILNGFSIKKAYKAVHLSDAYDLYADAMNEEWYVPTYIIYKEICNDNLIKAKKDIDKYDIPEIPLIRFISNLTEAYRFQLINPQTGMDLEIFWEDTGFYDIAKALFEKEPCINPYFAAHLIAENLKKANKMDERFLIIPSEGCLDAEMLI